jgi:hypothetical protein
VLPWLALYRVLGLLIDSRAAEQNFAAQLATKAGHIQQLVCDRDLALQKLCYSEEKLVAMEAQLVSLEEQLQQKQAGIAAQFAALDVAALAAGPLAGATSGWQCVTQSYNYMHGSHKPALSL